MGAASLVPQALRDASHTRDAHSDGASGQMRLGGKVPISQSGLQQDVVLVEENGVLNLVIRAWFSP